MSVRIYQLARQLGLDNKKVIELLQAKGMNVTSPSSTIPNVYADEFVKEFNKPTEEVQKEAPVVQQSKPVDTQKEAPVKASVKAPGSEPSLGAAGSSGTGLGAVVQSVV